MRFKLKNVADICSPFINIALMSEDEKQNAPCPS